MQGQVERLNGTVKLATTKAILEALHTGAENGNDFLQQLSVQQSWVEVMLKKVEVLNNTPKSLTRIAPLEAHFPDRIGRVNKFFTVDETHEQILNEANQLVNLSRKQFDLF